MHLSPGRVALAAGPGPGSADRAAPRLRLTVAGGPEPASGLVALDVPPGLVVEPAGPDTPLRYELAGGGFASWDLTARVLPGTPPGRYYVAARILDDLGQSLEDAALVTVGEPAAPRSTCRWTNCSRCSRPTSRRPRPRSGCGCCPPP